MTSRLYQYPRRSVLSTSLAAAASFALQFDAMAKPHGRPLRKVPLGLQLWSVREACAKDIDGTLKQVAACGFEGVEFAGLYKYENDAKGLRKTLDALGLRMEGSHVSVRAFGPTRLAKTIEFYKTLGCNLLIVGGDPRFTSAENSKAYADEMNAASQALKPHGLFCGHHNHTEEFEKVGDTTYWDLFAQRTNPDVFLQLDVGWALAAGLDPVVLMKRYPGRMKTLHLKVPPGKYAGDPILGNEPFNWDGIVKTSLEFGGAQWLVVEQEDYPKGMSALRSSELSLHGLKRIMARIKA